MGYLLIQTDESNPGAKERYLTAFLNHFKEVWNVNAKVTLTDKDITEIKTFLTVYPDAKYQLCYWHALKAVRTRLSILRRKPKYYNVDEAHKEFEFIDKSFVPRYQSLELNPVC